METYSPPNILFLKAVFLNNFTPIEDIFYQQLQERCDNRLSDEKGAEALNTEVIKMPAHFTNIQEWVKTTNLLCKNCSLKPHRMPVPVPISMNYCVETRISKISYSGICCSFVCARSHFDKFFESNARFDAMNMLKKVYKEFTGKNIVFIPPAPNYTEMDKYVGPSGISEAEYRKKIDQLEAALQ